MSRTMAMASLEATMDDKGLPVFDNMREHNSGEFSVEVLVAVKTTHDGTLIKTGRYSHFLNRWFVDGFSHPLVTEWWPIPKEGTGVKVGAVINDPESAESVAYGSSREEARLAR